MNILKTFTLNTSLLFLLILISCPVHSASHQPSHLDLLPDGLNKHEWKSIQEQVYNKSNSSNKTTVTTQQTSYLKASNPQDNDFFGYSVDISGNTLVVSAVEEDSAAVGVNGDQSDNSAENSGAVYVFVKVDGEWSQQAYLKASNTDANDWFGETVAIDGDTIVVGAILEDSSSININEDDTDNSSENTGAVYVFTRTNNTWIQQAYIKSGFHYTYPNGTGEDFFGQSVDISGDTLVIGTGNETGGSNGINGNESGSRRIHSGAAYVFIRNEDIWVRQAYIKASNPEVFDQFGDSVSISGDILVVGARGEDSEAIGVDGNPENSSIGNYNSGAAYVFKRENGTWTQNAYIKASNTGKNDQFGQKVSISGNTFVVTSTSEDSNTAGVNGDETNDSAEQSGAAYVFSQTNDLWSQEAYIKSSNSQAEGFFGISADILDNTIIIGAYSEDDNNLYNIGSAYVFTRNNGIWSQQSYLQASHPDTNDLFGNDVALSSNGDLIVGSWFEDSNALGINGDEDNNLTEDTGAVYVFEHSHDIFPIQAGHSALWFDPNQSGHGINIYMLDDNRLLAFWYVYDNNGKPLWLLGVGTHNGTKATLDVSIYNGAMFPPNFNPDDVVSNNWGQFEIEFNSCDNGLFKWIPEINNGFSAGQMNITRLNNTLGLECSDTLAKNKTLKTEPITQTKSIFEGFGLQAAHSALWFDPNQSGHGINVYMLADDRILMFWYVYDDDGNPIWLLGVGTHDGIKASVDVNIFNGTNFPPDFNSDDVTSTDWGQFELEFSGCDTGVFKWLPVAGNGFTDGQMDVVRLNNTLGLTCTE